MESIIPAIDLGIDFSKVKNIYLAQMPADLRKGIDGYVSLVQGPLALDPLDGSLFLFVNRQKNKIKGILRDGNGFWLVYKRLSRSSLQWPVSTDQSDFMRIDCSQLASLLSGLSIVPQPAFLPRTYKYV
ncbi:MULTISPECIES: IS66 family insertion sequence element accessory protein TnpB [Bacteria]|jgi:transposase|uniref:IS66 family insertion sequence element accessory protein TnpB n=1 Tax=Bacteria TaxID=2 RepID=UPI001E48E79A|nr:MULTISPECIES: IS66 family insertion sequence element accessory protein TnpB [Bacteria]UNT92106.1 IS66 family insertion sequence element accessory protein TnpB [Allobaculum sp. Allo2]UNT92127.1 IS66 family insertion sequence element accessory protein TnpB [Allobaculum sp. Allo2]UNT92184.1 IS66 family insertion sequence element accessory protein TnpB [Allobaculum sp. Allo2]UNT92272.1 IS66 family insertion sequence element accessory protein TnpB [Allobaculum sp. Allo2]UNT92290.1 IS66 family in